MVNLKNINFMSKERFDSLTKVSDDELYAVKSDVVVETYTDDDGNWCRVYSNGWVEQGGSIGTDTTNGYPTYTIPLLKPMANNKFNVQVTGRYTSKTAESGNYCYARTTTSISVVSIGYGSDWEVKGKGA